MVSHWIECFRNPIFVEEFQCSIEPVLAPSLPTEATELAYFGSIAANERIYDYRA